MPSTIDFSGLERLKKRVEKLGQVDYSPVVAEWAQTLLDDNERGLMAGEDAEGRPMPATQREQSTGRSQRQGSGKPLVPKGPTSRAIRNARRRASSSRRPGTRPDSGGRTSRPPPTASSSSACTPSRKTPPTRGGT